MKKTACARLLMFFLSLSLASMPSAAAQPADLVFRNGAVYTLDAARSWAEAVAVSRGRIVYVGPENGIGSWIGSGTTVVDLQGKMLLPGFQDSHLHLIAGGLQMSECRLETLTTPEQIVDAVRRCAQENPQKPWIRGQGWQLPLFPPTGPHKNLLDQAVPDRPVLLLGGDGHSASRFWDRSARAGSIRSTASRRPARSWPAAATGRSARSARSRPSRSR
jgi:hypothetical protein